MTERAEVIPEQEKYFQSLKQDIVSILLKRGAVQGSPVQALGCEIVTIVDDKWEGGYQALLLDVDGKWHGRHDMMPWGIDGSLENVVLEYAILADPQAKAIDRNFRPEEEESFEEGDQRREKELKEYVGENKELLADGLINTMRDRLEQLKDEDLSKQQGPQVTWKKYNNWRASLTREQRVMGRAHGQWPEGTSQAFIDLEARITAEDRILNSIFGEHTPSIEEILTRPDDYLKIKAEESRRRAEAHGGRLLRDQIESCLLSLNPRERRVLELRFGLEDGRSRTLEEAGREINRSRSTAWRVEHTALRKLRTPSRIERLQDYLGSLL